MSLIRALILNHRKLVLLLLALALCVKALVPAGFMVERNAMVLTISICADGLGAPTTQQMVIPMKPDAASHGGDHGKRDGSCAFTSLGAGALAAADASLLAIALLFILALGFVAVAQRQFITPVRLLPPAQGPPHFA